MLESIRYRWTLRKLTEEWTQYRTFVEQKLGFPGVTPVDEEAFLRLKARIASRIPPLGACLPTAALPDAQQQFTAMTDLLGRFRSLQAPAPLADKEREDVDQAWHQSFIFLNKLRGMRPVAQAVHRHGGRPFIPTGMPTYRRRRWGLPGAGLFRFAFRLLVFVIVVYVLGKTIGFGRSVEGRFGFQPPASFNAAVGNFVEASRNVGAVFGHIFSPVVAAYGIHATLILVGVLVLGVGYMIFVRG